MNPPVKRTVTTRAEAEAFFAEAAINGYEIVYVAPDVAALFGTPTSTAIPVLCSQYMPASLAVAFPSNPLLMNAAVSAFEVSNG